MITELTGGGNGGGAVILVIVIELKCAALFLAVVVLEVRL